MIDLEERYWPVWGWIRRLWRWLTRRPIDARAREDPEPDVELEGLQIVERPGWIDVRPREWTPSRSGRERLETRAFFRRRARRRLARSSRQRNRR